MKLYLSLFLTVFSLSSFSQLPDSLVAYYDTCTTNFQKHVFAQNISRANAWNDPRLSHAALFHAFEDIQKSNDSSEVSDIIMEHAILHAILRDWDSASFLFQEALVWVPAADSSQRGYLHRNIASVEHQLEHYETALDFGYSALSYLPIDDSLYRPLTYLEISKVLYKLQDYSLSEEYARKSARYFRESGRLYDLGSSYVNIALARLNTDSVTDTAIIVLHKSRVINLSLGDTISLAQSQINLGLAHLQRGNLDSASYYLRLAEKNPMMMNPGPLYQAPIVWVNLGTIYAEQGDFERAMKYTQMAYDSSVVDGETNFVRTQATDELSKLYLRLGDTAKAFEYFRQYHNLREKTTRLTNNNRMKSLEQSVLDRYRQRELEVLRQENEVNKTERVYLYAGIGVLFTLLLVLIQLFRLVQNRRKEVAKNLAMLNDIDKAKTRLFSIIGHDLRGPIGNSLFLLKELPQRGDKLGPDSMEVLGNVQQGLTEVHVLLENLLMWSKDQASGLDVRRSEVEILAIVNQCEQLVAPMLQSRRMKIDIQVDPELMWSIDSNIYSTILRNLVANASKYAPKESMIRVQAYVKGNELITSVMDTGAGIPEEIVKGVIDESLSTQLTAKGMGLHLVYHLVNEHGGTVYFNQKDDNWTGVIFRL